MSRSLASALLLLAALLCLAACGREPAGATSRGGQGGVAPGDDAPRGEGRRIALVVGNSGYASAPLANPANDADLVAATLKQVGFEVQLVKDGDQRRMKRAIQEFGATLEAAGSSAVGLFYYAGHGVQLGGRNYLIPVGADIGRDADLEIEAVGADWVMEQMRYARNRLNFVILDACRNNPFVRSFRSADRGLAKMDAPAGVLIAYSTAPGDVAADGDGRNSPYSAALARWIRDSDQPAELMFKQVRDAVRRDTAERQTPWESSSLTGDNFYFAARHVTAAPATVAVDEPLPSPSPVAPAPAREPAVNDPPPARPAAESPASIVMSDDFDPRTAPGDLCSRAAGDWQVESDLTPGSVRLHSNSRGSASLRFPKPARTVGWNCDAQNRRLVVRFDNGVEHTLTMDYVERLIFGYDQDGNAIIYNRR